MSYLARLKNLLAETGPPKEPTKPTKDAFVSSVSAKGGPFLAAERIGPGPDRLATPHDAQRFSKPISEALAKRIEALAKRIEAAPCKLPQSKLPQVTTSPRSARAGHFPDVKKTENNGRNGIFPDHKRRLVSGEVSGEVSTDCPRARRARHGVTGSVTGKTAEGGVTRRRYAKRYATPTRERSRQCNTKHRQFARAREG